MQTMLDTVVSPLPFGGGGRLWCVECHGLGHKTRINLELVGAYPIFQGNPPRTTWHVERDGQIVASGTGLSACSAWNYSDEQRAAIARLCDRIERAIKPKPRKRETETTSVQFKRDRDWLWVHFPAKPDQATLDALKQQGGRWSRKRNGWYFTNGDAVQARIEALVSV